MLKPVKIMPILDSLVLRELLDIRMCFIDEPSVWTQSGICMFMSLFCLIIEPLRGLRNFHVSSTWVFVISNCTCI